MLTLEAPSFVKTDQYDALTEKAEASKRTWIVLISVLQSYCSQLLKIYLSHSYCLTTKYIIDWYIINFFK